MQHIDVPRDASFDEHDEDNLGNLFTPLAIAPVTSSNFKEKFVSVYESLFANKELYRKNETFWEELFLLRVNSQFLENCIILSSEEELMASKTLHTIFSACLEALLDSSHMRRTNALQTLCILLKGIFKKKWSNFSVDVMTVVCGFQNADAYFKLLIHRTSTIIQKDSHVRTRQMALALIVILLTGIENINQNAIIDYFTIEDVFPCLLSVLEAKNSSLKMKKNALICLTILCNYRKYENMNNIYLKQLKDVQKPSSLMGICEVITKCLYLWNYSFEKSMIAQSGIINWVIGWFTNTTASLVTSPTSQIKPKNLNEISPILLAFYELIHLNDDFVGTVTRSLAAPKLTKIVIKDSSQSETTKSDVKLSSQLRGCPVILQEFFKLASILFQEPHYMANHVNKIIQDSTKVSTTTVEDVSTQYYTHFCVIILLCLLERKPFRQFMFDINVQLDFYVFKKEKGSFMTKEYKGTGSVARIIMDLLIDFLNHHLVKQTFSIDMYSNALTAVHSLICFGKKNRIRFGVQWKNLWSALIRICEVVAHDHCNREKSKASVLLTKVLTILNLSILSGDLFLPQRTDHDQLLYEIIRSRQVFSDLTDWTKRNLKKTNPVNVLMENILVVIIELSSSIDEKFGLNGSPSEYDALVIIKKAFPNLNLTKHANLEQRAEYLENPNEIVFFNHLTRLFVHECRQIVDHSFSPPK